MGLFRKRRPEVVRRGVGETQVEERTTKRVGGKTVEIRRIREVEPPKTRERKRRDRSDRNQGRRRSGYRQAEVIVAPADGKEADARPSHAPPDANRRVGRRRAR